jgi:hypothetical protein
MKHKKYIYHYCAICRGHIYDGLLSLVSPVDFGNYSLVKELILDFHKIPHFIEDISVTSLSFLGVQKL